MKVKTEYDAVTKKMTRVESWETVDEDGVIQHHQEQQLLTYHGASYVRLFKKRFRIMAKELSKTSYDAFFFILDKVSRETNIANVNYDDLEKYLEINNKSVSKVFIQLQSADVIRMYRRGQWMVNPELAVATYDAYIPRLIAMYRELPNERRNKNVTRQILRENTAEPGDECGAVYHQSHESGDEDIL